MKAANSLKADNYRKSGSHATCCRACEHFVDDGPYRRLCRVHQLGPASAYSGAVTPTVAADNICDKFMPKLRECPFCGGQAELISWNCHEPMDVYVQCSDCFAIGPRISSFWDNEDKVKKIAVELWNRRVKGGENDKSGCE